MTESVLIVGAGLIGSSIGMALTARGRRVYLRDEHASHTLVASSLGAGLVDEPMMGDVSLVVVAVPPSRVAGIVAESLRTYRHAVVTDVASVKSPILAEVEASGEDVTRYVGSHPMAGSHSSGPLTARADLFTERTWVITPHARSTEAAVALVRRLAQACDARVEIMDTAEHDTAVAEISHVPQIVSTLMAGSLVGVPSQHLKLAGQGVRDVTRIAGSEPDMWTQIITANEGAIRIHLDRFAQSLYTLLSHLDQPDAINDFLTRGVAGTKALPGKHGRAAENYCFVVVEIPDSPGALARLFADVDAVGVNVEDLEIEHDAAREVGYISIAVEPDRAQGLAQAMTDKGWSLKA